MKDYSAVAIVEAANTEITIEFVQAIKQMDSTLATERLTALVNSHIDSTLYRSLAASFCKLVSTKTCVDPE